MDRFTGDVFGPCCTRWIVLLVLLLLAATARSRAEEGPVRPNVVILLADDLGYGSLSCYGNTDYRTPHLDRLAGQGLRLTNFYVTTPGCAPSRAALLTGRYPFRSGMIRNPDPDYGLNQIGIPADEILLSELLQSIGYATSCLGKWHLGHLPDFYPRRHGFDEYFGIPYSNSSRPAVLVENEHVVEYPVVQANLTSQYTERALRFLEANQTRPFFLYVPYAMPHYPLAASERFYTPQTPDDLYADVIREMDHSVGRIMAKLDDLHLAQRTIVIFSSDNGPWFGGSTGGLRGMKGSTFEGGIRVPMITRWPGRLPGGAVRGQACSIIDILPTILAAAGADVPRDRTIDGLDLTPMLLDDSPLPDRLLYSVVGRRLASVRRGKWKLHVLPPRIPQWNDERFRPHKPDGVTIIAPPEQYPGTRFPGPLDGDPAQAMMLFDLDSDPAERHDFAASHPKVVKRLLAEVERFAAEIPIDLRMPQPQGLRRVEGPRRVTPQHPLSLQELFPGTP